MKTDEELQKRIAYEKMLAGISERAVSVNDLGEFLDGSLAVSYTHLTLPTTPYV